MMTRYIRASEDKMISLFGRAKRGGFSRATLEGKTHQTGVAVLAAVAVATLLVPGSGLGAAPDEEPFTLEIRNDNRVTLHAEDALLGAVLREIRSRTDVDIVMHADHLSLAVSVEIRSLPLEETIEVLLKGLDYSCVFDERGDLERVITLPSGGSAAARSFLPMTPRDAGSVSPPPGEDHPAEPATGLALSPEDTDLTGVMRITPPRETNPP